MSTPPPHKFATVFKFSILIQYPDPRYLPMAYPWCTLPTLFYYILLPYYHWLGPRVLLVVLVLQLRNQRSK